MEKVYFIDDICQICYVGSGMDFDDEEVVVFEKQMLQRDFSGHFAESGDGFPLFLTGNVRLLAGGT